MEILYTHSNRVSRTGCQNSGLTLALPLDSVNEYVSSFVLYILISCSLCSCPDRSLDSLVQLLGPKDKRKRARLVFLASVLKSS